jgi:hypothetical protein
MRTPATAFALTDDERATFERQGYLVLRGRIPLDTVDELFGVFSRTVDELATRWHRRGLISDVLADYPLDERYLGLLANDNVPVPSAWRRILVSETVFGLWQLPGLLGAVRSLLGEEVHAHGVWNGRPRDPFGRSQQVSWHQDAYYYRDWSAADGPLISAWIPLVEVDETSACLQFVTGSHERGWIPRQRLANGEYGSADTGADEDVFTARMQPGDVVLFTDTTLHQSAPNLSDHVRWSIDIRFARADSAAAARDRRGYRCASVAEPSSVLDFDQWQAQYRYEPEELLDELTNFEEGYDLAALRAFSKSSPFSDTY